MSDELDYRRLLDRSNIRIIEDLDPQLILNQCIDLLPAVTIRDIKDLKYTTDKTRAIIDRVRPTGIHGYLHFKDILRNTDQGHLADYLDEIEKEVKEDQKQKTIPITDRIDDGRIQIEDVAWIEDQIKSYAERLATGGTGNVYLLKDAVRWGGKVVVKKIERHKNSNLIINEIVAAKIRHHAIVPLIAKCNSDTHTFFVFPYMEKGELMTAIADDNQRMQEGSKVQMNATKRVSILHKIACAMLYIHEPVDRWRNKFVHGEITSRTIVLDRNDNPRLIDFGIARELILGTDTVPVKSEDITESSSTQLSTETDCRHFGVLIKEMLTDSKPIDDDNRQLQKDVIDPGKTGVAACYGEVWKNETGVYNTLKKLAVDCSEKKVNASKITQDLYDILRDLNQESTTEELGVEKCSLCMVNRIDADDTNLYLQNCFDSLSHEAPPVCVSCMRNSYLNPIQCLRCTKTIPTKIGYSWGAILITGSDKEEKYCEAINKDVQKMKEILTSKYPLVIGLSENNVIITTLDRLSEAIQKLEECKTLSTVIVYYSGHYTADSGVDKTYFESCLIAIEKKVILIMDCCFCPDLVVSIQHMKLQINASRHDERAGFTIEGSTFTQVFVETLRRMSTDSLHKDNPGFISVFSLFKQIKNDMKQQGCDSTPTIKLIAEEEADLVIGYTHNATGMKFVYEDKDNRYFEVDILNTIKELKAELLKEVFKDRYKEPFLENHGDTLTTYSDIIEITIRKGPHERGIHELSSMKEVTRAWNQKFELSFGIRNVKNIHNNTKVGIFLDEIKTQDILQRYLMNIGGDIYKNTNETIVKVQWTQKAETMDKLYNLKPTVEQAEDVAYRWLWDRLVEIYGNHRIKGATHVVFTVPSGLWKKDENDFLTIELEGLAIQ